MTLKQPFVWTQAGAVARHPLHIRTLGSSGGEPVAGPERRGADAKRRHLDGAHQPAGGAEHGRRRLDQAVTSRVTLFGRYNDSPSTNQFGSLQVNRLNLRSQSLTLGLNARPTSNLTADLRVNESQSTANSLVACRSARCSR